MKKIKFKKYRIVKDNCNGYECQVWRLWFPFWVEMNFSNTHTSIEKAKCFIENNSNTVVWKS
jgi:hypothetical protein